MIGIHVSRNAILVCLTWIRGGSNDRRRGQAQGAARRSWRTWKRTWQPSACWLALMSANVCFIIVSQNLMCGANYIGTAQIKFNRASRQSVYQNEQWLWHLKKNSGSSQKRPCGSFTFSAENFRIRVCSRTTHSATSAVNFLFHKFREHERQWYAHDFRRKNSWIQKRRFCVCLGRFQHDEMTVFN